MRKLLINNTKGKQEIITVSDSGGYFDHKAILWDENKDGKLPSITLGGMERVNGKLVFNSAVIDANNAITMAESVAKKKVEIDTAYRDALNAGVTYKTALFQSDENSVQSLVKVLTALANSWVLPARFVWVDAANVAHPATKAWLQGLIKAFGDHEATLFARKLQAKGALAAIDLTSPTAIADIQAVVF